MLSLYKLEIFAAVVNEGSFSAAALRLFMTQPAVSQHIQDLETRLGTPLFSRVPRGVVLTQAGETLYSYTQRILRLVAEAESAVTNVDKLTHAQLNIGATPGVAVYLLPDWFKGFQAAHPNLGISLQTSVTPQVAASVLGNKLDLGFVEGDLDNSHDRSLGSIILQAIEQRLVISSQHHWANREGVQLADLSDEAFIMRQPGSRTRIWMDTILAAHGITPRIVAEFDNPEAIKQAVMADMGVSILPAYTVQHEVRLGLLKALPVTDVRLMRNLRLIYRQEAFTPLMRALLNYLEDEFPQLGSLLN